MLLFEFAKFQLKVSKLYVGFQAVKLWRCGGGGSLVVHQTSGAEVPGLNPASPTMILMRCRIIVIMYVEHLRVERETYPRGKKDFFKTILTCQRILPVSASRRFIQFTLHTNVDILVRIYEQLIYRTK